jgi:hypothetical protein
VASEWPSMKMTKTTRKGRRRPNRSRGQWAKEVARWRRSGLKSAEYAAKNDLSQSALLWWSCQVRKGARATRRGGGSRGLFLPVRVTADVGAEPQVQTPHLEVVLVNGRRVRVVGDVDLVRVRQLLDAAEGRSGC